MPLLSWYGRTWFFANGRMDLKYCFTNIKEELSSHRYNTLCTVTYGNKDGLLYSFDVALHSVLVILSSTTL